MSNGPKPAADREAGGKVPATCSWQCLFTGRGHMGRYTPTCTRDCVSLRSTAGRGVVVVAALDSPPQHSLSAAKMPPSHVT